MPWPAGGGRRRPLPKDWPARRAATLARDPTCKLRFPGCTVRSTQADHVDPDGGDGLDNLQGACGPCHAKKSSSEGNARHRLRHRPAEQHPGAIA